MAIKTSQLKGLSFAYNYLQIDTSRIDKFLKIADEDYDSLVTKYGNGLEQLKIDQKILQEVAKASRVGFSLYALAISDCASVLENNRAEILKRIPNLSKKELRGLFKIKVVEEILERVGIDHESVLNYARADEFRLVCNKIKHARFAYSNTIKLDPPKGGTSNGEVYNFGHLRELYKTRLELHDYLKDLFDKINEANL